MCQISIQIPAAVLYDTHMNQEEATAFAQRIIALGYYTQNNVSIDYCAQIACMAEKEKIADLVIIDDNAAKKTAKYLGVPVTGTIGVLLKANCKGYITEIAPVIEDMCKNGFYISEALKKIILKQAGE